MLLGGSAFAADLPMFEAPVEPLPVPAFSWTGFYVGAAGGYAWGNGEVNFFGIGAPGDEEVDSDGWMIGPFVGYQYQWRNVVFGVEGDLEWTDIDGDDDDGDGFDVGVDIDWQGSLRGRLGYAFDRALIYGTGGFSLAGVDTEGPGGGGDDDGDGSTEWGWNIGAGLDFAVTDRVFVRGEYRYTNLSDFDNDDDSGEVQDFDSHAVRLGVGFMF
jgi:outer membrane immunogenic protein